MTDEKQMNDENKNPIPAKNAPRVYCALVHYPTIDRRGLAVATSVTTLDVHDIARSSRTFGIKRYYVVTPIEPQHWIVNRIIEHWESDWGHAYNPNRGDALGTVELVGDVGSAADKIQELEGVYPTIVATSARNYPNTMKFEELRWRIHEPNAGPFLIIFGTGWGLHPELIADCDITLEPIFGPTPYNHLSVRSAAVICFDRLLSPWRNGN